MTLRDRVNQAIAEAEMCEGVRDYSEAADAAIAVIVEDIAAEIGAQFKDCNAFLADGILADGINEYWRGRRGGLGDALTIVLGSSTRFARPVGAQAPTQPRSGIPRGEAGRA